MNDGRQDDQIDAEPTKSFFIDMLTRDIILEQAILDLVDNSVDGAKSRPNSKGKPYDGRTVEIQFDKDQFRIWDNCGGFDKDAARLYAFRFGRAVGATATPHSIGQFGVGMKRALFKFGRAFTVRSATGTDAWGVKVDVPEWESQKGWHFPWEPFVPDAAVSNDSPGTEIIVTNLRSEVAAKFGTQNFTNQIVGLIKSKHRQFVASGLSVSVNGRHVDASNLYLLMTADRGFTPGVRKYGSTAPGKASVQVGLVAGIGLSNPREAGWYVVCNGRVILEADRRTVTGWGAVEEATNSVVLPNYHNQFARFRGIATFDCEDSGRVPWNTTKSDVDQDSPVWQLALARMTELMRPVIDFLNELDADIDEHTKESSPLLRFVSAAIATRADDIVNTDRAFSAPTRASVMAASTRIRTVKVQYSRPVEQVDFLMEELGLNSAKAVGEKSFDLLYSRKAKE